MKRALTTADLTRRFFIEASMAFDSFTRIVWRDVELIVLLIVRIVLRLRWSLCATDLDTVSLPLRAQRSAHVTRTVNCPCVPELEIAITGSGLADGPTVDTLTVAEPFPAPPRKSFTATFGVKFPGDA